MKIVYLYTALTTIGGADRIIVQKANYLADVYKHDIYIITDSQNKRPFSFPLSKNVKHIDLDINFDKQYKYNLLIRYFVYKSLMIKYKKKLLLCLNKIKPQITISTLGRDMDFLTDLNDGSQKVAESHIARHYMRNLHLMEAKGGISKLIAQYWRKKQEKAIKKLDALVVLTKADADHWKEIKQKFIIPNPITLEPNGYSSCTGNKIISVGRLTEQKGYDLLINAWKAIAFKHPDWIINIYGEGELHDKLQQQICDSHLEKQIILCKPVTNISEKYIESSFYVMSSRFEGFGLVLTEAMCCGLPCISFDCPSGPSEIIKDKEDGLLVENGNINALADSICFMIENEEKRIQMGKKAKGNVMRYSTEHIMQQWNELFKGLIQKQQ